MEDIIRFSEWAKGLGYNLDNLSFKDATLLHLDCIELLEKKETEYGYQKEKS
jgi:hypothetical protein